MPDPTLVVIPTFNEADNISLLIEAVLRAVPHADVLVVDDASPDGTAARVQHLAARDPRVHLIERGAKLGIGSAYVAGFNWGRARAYARFIQMDADFSHEPKFLSVLTSALDDGADVAIGSRNVAGGAIEGWGLFRHLLSKGGSLYARTMLRSSVRDMTSGFKAYTRRALELLDVVGLRSNGYAFQIETTHRALALGLRVREVPIVFVDRRAGRSKMSRREVIEAVVAVWRLRPPAFRTRPSP